MNFSKQFIVRQSLIVLLVGTLCITGCGDTKEKSETRDKEVNVTVDNDTAKTPLKNLRSKAKKEIAQPVLAK